MEVYGMISIAQVLFAFLLLTLNPSTCYVLKGSVSCKDCTQHSQFSGIKVLVKCSQVKKSIIATTKPDGSFITELPSHAPKPYCLARILGGSDQLYGSHTNMVRPIIKTRGSKDSYFVLSKSLEFYKRCPLKDGKCGANAAFGLGNSKTVDIPFPREWGLPPSSYYLAPFFFPIIAFMGIP